MSKLLKITADVLPLRCGTSIRIGKQIKKQAVPNFDLRGERYGAIISILHLAICFNRVFSFDEELPNGQQPNQKAGFAEF